MQKKKKIEWHKKLYIDYVNKCPLLLVNWYSLFTPGDIKI